MLRNKERLGPTQIGGALSRISRMPAIFMVITSERIVALRLNMSTLVYTFHVRARAPAYLSKNKL